jgi:hypothetical protein
MAGAGCCMAQLENAEVWVQRGQTASIMAGHFLAANHFLDRGAVRCVMKRAAVLLVVGSLFLAGCTKYYAVTDPTTKKVYYTTKLDENKSGSTTFKDAKTGQTVTVQNTEVKQIKKDEFKAGTKD